MSLKRRRIHSLKNIFPLINAPKMTKLQSKWYSKNGERTFQTSGQCPLSFFWQKQQFASFLFSNKPTRKASPFYFKFALFSSHLMLKGKALQTGVIDRGEGLKNSFEWVAPLVKVEIGVTHGGQAAAQQWLLCHRSVHCCIWASYPMQPSRSPPQDFGVISASNIPISTMHSDV